MNPHQRKFAHVGEGLYRYSNGVYYGRFKIGRKREKFKSLRTTDRKLAERNLVEMRNGYRGLDHIKSKITLAALCDRWLGTRSNLKSKTVERDQLVAKRLIEYFGPHTQAGAIRQTDIALWLNRRRYAPATRNKFLNGAKAVFQSAVKDKILLENPAAGIKSGPVPTPIRRTPTKEEFQAIVASIREQRFSDTAQESADVVEFMGLSGLGTAETGALKWSDIDWRRGKILTYRHKTDIGFEVPIFPQLRPLLERRKENAHGVHVFTVRRVSKAIASACQRLNLPRYTPRSFRRYFITTAIERGVDVKVIAGWQAHGDGGRLILSTYSHVNTKHADAMAELMKGENRLKTDVAEALAGGANPDLEGPLRDAWKKCLVKTLTLTLSDCDTNTFGAAFLIQAFRKGKTDPENIMAALFRLKREGKLSELNAVFDSIKRMGKPRRGKQRNRHKFNAPLRIFEAYATLLVRSKKVPKIREIREEIIQEERRIGNWKFLVPSDSRIGEVIKSEGLRLGRRRQPKKRKKRLVHRIKEL